MTNSGEQIEHLVVIGTKIENGSEKFSYEAVKATATKIQSLLTANLYMYEVGNTFDHKPKWVKITIEELLGIIEPTEELLSIDSDEILDEDNPKKDDLPQKHLLITPIDNLNGVRVGYNRYYDLVKKVIQ